VAQRLSVALQCGLLYRGQFVMAFTDTAPWGHWYKLVFSGNKHGWDQELVVCRLKSLPITGTNGERIARDRSDRSKALLRYPAPLEGPS